MGTRLVATTDGVRSTQVLDLVAGGTQRDHADEALDERRVVVAPLLVALDGVGGATATADLTAIAGVLVGPPSQDVPRLARELRP